MPTIGPSMASRPGAGFGPLPDVEGLTIRSLLDAGARAHPDRVFSTFPESHHTLTWAELREAGSRVSARLSASGVPRGAGVGILMSNGRTALELFLGCMYAGRITATFNPVAGLETLAYVIAHSGVTQLYTDEAHVDLAEGAVKLSGSELTLQKLDKDSGLPDSVSGRAERSRQPDPGDDALLVYTSGTTGRPKGVIHTHASLLAGGANTVSAHRLERDDRALCVLPLCHINGQVVTVIAPLVSRSSVVLPSRFSTSNFWEWIVTEGCTWFSVVPTMLSYLLDREGAPRAAGENKLAHVRFGRSASAPLAPAVHRAFVERFGIPLVETMGVTEAAAQILSNPLDPAVQKIGSPGCACGNEVRIGEPGTPENATSREGEIEVYGPNIMRAYLNDEAATRKAFTTDGWYRTGDLGRMDRDGFVFVTGRRKELIIKGGENISPREIDDVLYRFPGILEAAAIGVPDPDYGEEIAACVVAVAGVRVDERALRDFCIDTLGSFKAPRFFHFLDALPKGPSGKIQRLKLSGAVSRLAQQDP